jgi:hypothetical protein
MYKRVKNRKIQLLVAYEMWRGACCTGDCFYIFLKLNFVDNNHNTSLYLRKFRDVIAFFALIIAIAAA